MTVLAIAKTHAGLTESQVIIVLGVSVALFVLPIYGLHWLDNLNEVRLRVTRLSLSRQNRDQSHLLLFSAVAVVAISPIVAVISNLATEQLDHIDKTGAAGFLILLGLVLGLLLLGSLGASRVIERIESRAATWPELRRDAFDVRRKDGPSLVDLQELDEIRQTLTQQDANRKKPRILRVFKNENVLEQASNNIKLGAKNGMIARETVKWRKAAIVALTTPRGALWLVPAALCALTSAAAPTAFGSGAITSVVAVVVVIVIAGASGLVGIAALHRQLVVECLPVLEEMRARDAACQLIDQLHVEYERARLNTKIAAETATLASQRNGAHSLSLRWATRRRSITLTVEST